MQEKESIQEDWWTEKLMDDQITGYFSTEGSTSTLLLLSFFFIYFKSIVHVASNLDQAPIVNVKQKILLQEHPC